MNCCGVRLFPRVTRRDNSGERHDEKGDKRGSDNRDKTEGWVEERQRGKDEIKKKNIWTGWRGGRRKLDDVGA